MPRYSEGIGARVGSKTDSSFTWLRLTPPQDRKIAVAIYGFPPNVVGAVGTAVLTDVPKSLEALLNRLSEKGYDVGNWLDDPDASGESLVAALPILCENPVVTAGASLMQNTLDLKIICAKNGDDTIAATLGRPNGGLGLGAKTQSYSLSTINYSLKFNIL